MTDQEVLDALRSETPLNAARRAFSSACGQIEQAHQQRQPCSPIEMRRMEFEAVRRIAAALGASGYENGISAAARMARDMADKMLAGELPQLGGPAALQLFATMLDRIVAE